MTLPHSGLARAALFSLRLRELHDAEDEDTMHDGRWYTMQESPGQRLESGGIVSTVVDSFHLRAVWILSTGRLSVVRFV